MYIYIKHSEVCSGPLFIKKRDDNILKDKFYRLKKF